MQPELFTPAQAQALKARLRAWDQDQAKRRRSDRLSPRDQALKHKLEQGPFTRRELEWIRDADPRLPLILMAIINSKLRALEELTQCT
jgi:protein involved in temperature-dependent protein secretion